MANWNEYKNKSPYEGTQPTQTGADYADPILNKINLRASACSMSSAFLHTDPFGIPFGVKPL